MKIKLLKLWLAIRSSMWFVPALMSLATVLFAFAVIYLDRRIDVKYHEIVWFAYGGSPEGARSLLSSVASSMVTIMGVTFSITLVALALASSQFGPRLLRNFIKDRGNQFVMGTFISTFIFSLIVLMAVRGFEAEVFVPKIGVAFSFILSIYSLGVLIYFIHHVSSSIQADNVIKNAFQELMEDIDKFMRDGVKGIDDCRVTEEEAFEAIKERPFYQFYSVGSNDAGYLQIIDIGSLQEWAEERNCIIHVLVRAGEFVARKETIVQVYWDSDLTREDTELINSAFILGYQRTPDQDIEYSIRQIVEIAIRALSPGINDPHTAISCIQWLGSAITKIADHRFPYAVRVNQNDAIRLILKRYSYAGIVECCYGHLRQYAQGNAEVSLAILTALRMSMEHAVQTDLRDALKNMADIVVQGNQVHVQHPYDLKRIDDVYKKLIKVYSL